MAPTSFMTAWMLASEGVICQDCDAAIVVNERSVGLPWQGSPEDKSPCRPLPQLTIIGADRIDYRKQHTGVLSPHVRPVNGLSLVGLAPVARSLDR